jgi:S-methylmethionine-dependent homocysteine/selenocysteine methylase
MDDRLSTRLSDSRPLILDGATGTELERLGVPPDPPLWSTRAIFEAPELVAKVHADHAGAGADIIVTNTFRCGPRALSRAGIEDRGGELVSSAVQLARKTNCIVGVSVAPAEDCYQPESVPGPDELDREHQQLADWIAEASPDLVWIETMNTAREAGAAARAASERGLPFAVNFVLSEENTLLSGEPISAGFDAVCGTGEGPVCIGINCIPPKGATKALPRILELADGRIPVSVYAHVGNPKPVPGWSFAQVMHSAEYAEAAGRWVSMGASGVGGCCGTTSEYISAIRSTLERDRQVKDPRWKP